LVVMGPCVRRDDAEFADASQNAKTPERESRPGAASVVKLTPR
jgi:hypothetical protein